MFWVFNGKTLLLITLVLCCAGESCGILKAVHEFSINFTKVKETVIWDATKRMRNPENIGYWLNHAKSQGIILPTNYSIGVCLSSIISMKTITCDNAPTDIPVDIQRIDKDLAIAYDLKFHSFQHTFINGIPSASLLVDWVLEKENRAFLCLKDVCEFLKSVEGITDSMLIPAHLPIWANSVTAAYIDWAGLGLVRDIYPFGSYFPAIKYTDKLLRHSNWTRKSMQVPCIHFILLISYTIQFTCNLIY